MDRTTVVRSKDQNNRSQGGIDGTTVVRKERLEQQKSGRNGRYKS
jgi:hypothetical protein